MKRISAAFGSMMIAAVLISTGCEKVEIDAARDNKAAVKNDAAAPAAQIPPPATPGTVTTISFMTSQGPVPFSVEVAESDEDRARGLMGRESLADDSGMWFLFPQMIMGSFHMAGTLIPLDWVFLDDEMRVVHIKENNTPQDPEPYMAPVPFRYVLEVKAGTVAKSGIKSAIQLRSE